MGNVTRKSVGLPRIFCSSDDKNNHKNEDTPSRPMYVYILREQGILLKDKLERPESDGLTLISTPLHVLPMWHLPWYRCGSYHDADVASTIPGPCTQAWHMDSVSRQPCVDNCYGFVGLIGIQIVYHTLSWCVLVPCFLRKRLLKNVFVGCYNTANETEKQNGEIVLVYKSHC